MRRRPSTVDDADALLVRRTAARVGIWITIAVSVLVIAVLVAAFAFVLNRVPLGSLLNPQLHEEKVYVGGLDILVGGLVIGGFAVLLAGTLGLLATRRAVAPLVDALRRQRRFVADASHELRTPLAILDARLQVMQRSIAASDPHFATVEELRVDSRNLIAVVTDLLGSIEVSPSDHPVMPLAVVEAVDAAVDAMQLLGRDHGVAVVATDVPADVSVAMPRIALHRALVALVDNAIKHSPPGESVTIVTRATRSRVAIAVVDHGTGIRGIEPERVFDRFARSSEAIDGGGNARTGFGIGLSLVHDTVGRLGGATEVTDTGPGGTTITMRLPRARA